MTVVAVLGSPSMTSNSSKLAEIAIDVIDPTGTESKRFVVNELRALGCQSCYTCKTKSEFCVLTDDLSLVLSTAAAADFLIVTAPVYIGSVSAQAKIFIDRTFSWMKPDFKTSAIAGRLSPGKKCLFIMTQGNPDPAVYQGVYESFLAYFSWLGFKTAGVLASGLEAADVTLGRLDLVKEVEEKVKGLLA
ncbi:MAG: flavodoxin family protein [Deltaproteobacteria bacterium]|jgi:multimeric flavodoxin WrbA|nr:flavodoxin family protein [Deltaproteobacteria bacterium]